MNNKTLLIIIGVLSAIVLAMAGFLLFSLGRQSAAPTREPVAETVAQPAPVKAAPPVESVAQPSDPAELAEQWRDAYTNCRGGAGDDPATAAACQLEEQIGQKLEAAGWCYRPGKFEWKPC